MKRWIVLVTLFGDVKRIDVTADYYKVAEGTLTFRNWVRDGYPEPVQTFAHGYWLEVQRA